jgi:hypothetical protein
VSVQAITAAFTHSASTGAARLVLLAMADEASTDGYLTAYRRSQSWFASKANCDERTVRRAIDQLVQLGEVVVIEPGDGRRQSDYRLVLPGLGQPGPPLNPDGEPLPREGNMPAPRVGSTPGGEGNTPAPSTRSNPVSPVTEPPLPPTGQLALVPERPTAAPSRRSGMLVSFDAFWAVYPRREGKGAARKAWDKACRKANPQDIIIGAKRYAADPNREPQYTAHAATWLNAERWTDDPLPERQRRGASGTVAAARRVMAATAGMSAADLTRPALSGQAARVAAMLEAGQQ